MIPRSTNSRILTALGALGLLSLLLIGVPVALWAIAGSPLPSSVPSVTDVVDGLTHGPIADSTITQIVALIGWIAWIQVALSIVVETVAWARGRSAQRIAFAGPIQPAVMRLVATATLLLSSANVKTAPLGAMPNPSSHVSIVESRFGDTTEPTLAATPAAKGREHVSSTPTTAKTHVVERRDTLWGLAETHLGDPFRWRDLYELNRCKPQPDGRVLEDPNLIVVGWRLAFPDDAVGLEPVPVEETRPPPQRSEVGVDGTAVAATPPPTCRPIAAPTTVVTHGAAEPSTPPRAVRQPEPEPHTPPTTNDGDRGPDDDSEERSRRLAPLIGGSLLAAALVFLIDRLRRVSIRQRRITSHAPPDEKLQTTEINLRHAADLDGATRLDLALRALATGLNRRGIDDIAILAIRLDGDSIEVLLDRPAASPLAGFESIGDPRGWRLDAGLTEDDLRVLANGATAPLPSLVTIGTADGDPVLIDIETAGLLTITGPTPMAPPYLRRLVTELATSTWTDHLDLITVGESLGDVIGSQRSRHFTSLDDAIQHVHGIARACDQGLTAAGHATTIRARVGGDHGDGWIPTILICSEEVPSESLDEIAEWIQPGRGVGMVLAGQCPGVGWHVRLTESRVHVTPHNLALEPVLLEAETAEAIDQILTNASGSPAESEERLESDGAFNGTSSAPVADCDPFEEPGFDVEFRVLGHVDIVGAPPINRRKSIEIAVYLALHPDGVTDDRLKTVFWPDGTPTQSTFNTTVSMTRSALGTAANGELYLPHYASSGQRYRLSERVTTDLARFEARAAFAKEASAAQARAALADALEMVRGQPFDVGRGYEWTFAEGFVTRAALAIAEAAHHLAELALDADDDAQAEWAATQGLLASPGDEALYRDRMLAAHHAGNTAAIKQIMSELCEVVEANEPYDQLHPDTVTLFKSLLGVGTPAPSPTTGCINGA